MTLVEAIPIHGAFRRLHYSPHTEEAYVHWIRVYSSTRARSAASR